MYAHNMPQTATYWAPGATDEFGAVAFGAGVPVACRWQDDAQMMRDAEGREFISRAIIYCDHAAARQGFIALGDFVGSDPRALEGAHQIRQVMLSPSLDGAVQLCKVIV